MLNRLRDVFSSLHNHRVKYVVIGGIAAVLHGVPRATFDVDMLPENAQRLLDAFLDAKLGTAALVWRRCVTSDNHRDQAGAGAKQNMAGQGKRHFRRENRLIKDRQHDVHKKSKILRKNRWRKWAGKLVTEL